jgi:DNA (cytosine-5)-methyltransferase 1
MNVLNLYAGIGGNRKLWDAVDVVAVEWDEQIAAVYERLYPQDQVVVADAHQYLLDHHTEFDLVWSSPPCQSHSRMQKAGRNRTARYPDLALYEEVIFLKHFHPGLFVVENVQPYYDQLVPATRVGRHLFWSNFTLDVVDVPRPKGFINQKDVSRDDLMDWLDIRFEERLTYDGNHCSSQILRNAVHPKLGLQILDNARGTHTERPDQLQFANE